MKKLIFLSVALFAITACQKDPDMGELSGEYAVFTSYDASKFPTTQTKVYVPTVIKVLNSNGTEPTNWDSATSAAAASIINNFKAGLAADGYATNGVQGTDLELSLVYTLNVSYFYDYAPYYWWWDWDGGWWPYWYYPYPYAYVYEYTTASFVAELTLPNPTSASLKSSSTLPVLWNVFIGGYDYGSQETNGQYIARRVGQAFAQSPYLKPAAQ